MKKFSQSLIILVISVLIFAQSAANATNLKKGDIDGDKDISSFDAYKALEISVSGEETTAEQLQILDIDGDGYITSFDAYQILSYSVGIIYETYWKTPELEPEPEPEPEPTQEPVPEPTPAPAPIHVAEPIEGRYYYNQLDKYGKILYNGIVANKENLATEDYEIEFTGQLAAEKGKVKL